MTDRAAELGRLLGCIRTQDAVLRAFTVIAAEPVGPIHGPSPDRPLGGIPIAIKDIVDTADMPTCYGSAIYDGHRPRMDAAIVTALKQAGAFIVGKTTTTEFATSPPTQTRNPRSALHTPGGSSSGSAAAVAAGLVPLALGTQTLGSVIRPAAFNGVVGFKPSFGAIPRTGVHPLSPSLDHVGFFSRRVDDVALALSLVGGSSDSDRRGRPVPVFDVLIEQGLSAIEKPRLAVVRFTKWSRAEPEQQLAFEAAIAKMRDAGAIVEDLDLADLDQGNWSTVNTILASEGAFIFSGLVEQYPDRTSDHLKSLVQAGKAHGAFDYLAAKAAQEKLRLEFAESISKFDAVLTLPAFGEAPEGLSYTGDAEYCAPWTLLGVPAISLPAGFGKKGLPLGIQVVGAYREDHRTLRVAKWIESALKFNPGNPVI